MADDRDNLQIIIDGLNRYPGPKKDNADWKNIRCPFHGDTDPSLGVYTRLGGKFKLGFFHCFGCGKSGDWNVFANQVGLDPITSWGNSESSINSNLVTLDLEDELLGNIGLTFNELKLRMHCNEAQRWPPDLNWRGVPGQLVRDVGGHIIGDDINDSIAVLFPIKIAGKVRGGVKAVYEKADGQKGKLGYITMKGEWIKSYGLFPYVYVKTLLRKTGYNFVLIVEGPRDALRLVKNGIPALAILGANSVNRTKLMFVLSLGIRYLYVMSDGDKGGDTAWAAVKKLVDPTKVELKRIKLPEHSDKGKKYDPGNMPKVFLRRLASLLNERHYFDKTALVE